MKTEREKNRVVTSSRRSILKKSAALGLALGTFAPSSLLDGSWFGGASWDARRRQSAARTSWGIARAHADAVAPANVLAGFKKHPGLIVLGDRPLNAETPAHLLDDDTTSADVLFVRNNGQVPDAIDAQSWTLTVEGESVERAVTFTLSEIKRMPSVTRSFVLECGGNGRSEFSPPAPGNQWTTGALGCPTWTGVPLKHLLKKAGVKKDAVYVGYVGKDLHLTGDTTKKPISRGVPIKKALDDDTLVAYAMNGADIPLLHGFPLRLVAPGYPASASGKWLTTLLVRNVVHDGAKMTGKSYRVPCEPVRPGAEVPDDQMCILEEMPVKSLITKPASGVVLDKKSPLTIRGHAWSGHGSGVVKEVFTSIDFGQTWTKATLKRGRNRFDWQRFTSSIKFPSAGYFEVWARAVDARGVSQPMVTAGWNPAGYAGNPVHRIAVQVR